MARQSGFLKSIRRRAKVQRVRRWVMWGGLLFVAYNFLGGPFGFIHYRQIKNRHRELEMKEQRLLAEMVDLEQEINRLKGDTLYIEKVARERYGFARKGERIYKVVSH